MGKYIKWAVLALDWIGRWQVFAMIMLPASIPGTLLYYLSLAYLHNPPLAIAAGIAVTFLIVCGSIFIMDYVHKKRALTMSIKALLEDRGTKKVMLFGVKNIGSKNIYDVVLKLNKSEFSDHIGVHLDGIKGWDVSAIPSFFI
jgi:hypothetical protein